MNFNSNEEETPQEKSIKKVTFNFFAIFTRKSLFTKVAEETPTQVFPVNIAKFLRTPILKNICEPLLLKLVNFFFPFATFKSMHH